MPFSINHADLSLEVRNYETSIYFIAQEKMDFESLVIILTAHWKTQFCVPNSIAVQQLLCFGPVCHHKVLYAGTHNRCI